MMTRDARRILLLLFSASLACLAFEIALLRLFSITLWHHFAFLVVTVALLGIGASGTALFLLPRLKDIRLVPWFALLVGIMIPAVYILAGLIPFDPARLSWDRLQLLYAAGYALLLSVPFFCFGLMGATALSLMSEQSGLVYAADLGGAAAGSLCALALLSVGGPEQAIFAIALLPVLVAAGVTRGPVRAAAAATASVLLSLLLLQPDAIRPRISSYKPLSAALRYPGAEHLGTAYSASARVDLFRSPAVRYAPGLSLTYGQPLPDQVGLAVDAGDLHAVTLPAAGHSLAFLDYLPSRLPYLLTDPNNVLVLEPRAGLPLLAAQRHGAHRVFAVDSQGLVIKVVRDVTAQLPQPLYAGNVHAGLGRAWLRARSEQFDVIDLSLTAALPAGGFGFAEDHRLTIEAFRTYLDRLAPDGVLSLTAYLIPPPRTELRLLATLLAAAEENGLGSVQSRIAAIRSWGTITIVFKKSGISDRDREALRRFCDMMRFDPVYYPGIRDADASRFIKTPDNEPFSSFQRVLDPATREEFLRSALFDLRPVTDDRPFFHYYLRASHAPEIYRVMGRKVEYFLEEGYLLPVLFGQVLLLGALVIVLPLRWLPRQSAEGAQTLPAPLVLASFACLGLAYFFVEVPLIQNMILLLETPTLAFGTVLVSMLLSSGIGSYVSARAAALRTPWVVLVTSGAVLLVSVAAGLITAPLVAAPPGLKIALLAALLAPAGFFMGVPFPLGMGLLGRVRPGLIPWAWAVNGCFSVLAPVLAIMLALSTGFSVVLYCGAALYAAAFLALWRITTLVEGSRTASGEHRMRVQRETLVPGSNDQGCSPESLKTER